MVSVQLLSLEESASITMESSPREHLLAILPTDDIIKVVRQFNPPIFTEPPPEGKALKAVFLP